MLSFSLVRFFLNFLFSSSVFVCSTLNSLTKPKIYGKYFWCLSTYLDEEVCDKRVAKKKKNDEKEVEEKNVSFIFISYRDAAIDIRWLKQFIFSTQDIIQICLYYDGLLDIRNVV